MPKEIPKRAVYKAAEVCELARIQPYVLRSWESEFPRLGVVRAGARIYRPADLDQVLRIKQLVFEEGLTLAGARRRLEEDTQPQPELPLEELVTPEIRQRIGRVRQGLEELLSMLGHGAVARDGGRPHAGGGGGRAAAPVPPPTPAAPAQKTPRKSTTGSRSRKARTGRRHAGRG
jgi:DNA-binding transcriptional MerR regulator